MLSRAERRVPRIQCAVPRNAACPHPTRVATDRRTLAWVAENDTKFGIRRQASQALESVHVRTMQQAAIARDLRTVILAGTSGRQRFHPSAMAHRGRIG